MDPCLCGRVEYPCPEHSPEGIEVQYRRYGPEPTGCTCSACTYVRPPLPLPKFRPSAESRLDPVLRAHAVIPISTVSPAKLFPVAPLADWIDSTLR